MRALSPGSFRSLIIVCVVLACGACTKKVLSHGIATLGESCDADDDCATGLCRGQGKRYCSALCATDVECASPDADYCCDLLGGQGLCQKAENNECRGAELGTACGGVGDPLCGRVGLECARTGNVFSCTKECTSAGDCVGLDGASCDRIGERALCVPPDLSTLVRRESNCVGDRSCNGEEICQVFSDSDLDPRDVVTQCSSLRYGNLPVGSTCTAGEQCDRGFCVEGYCSAPCASDEWCPTGQYCRSLTVVARPDDPDTDIFEGIYTSVRMCRQRVGSELVCDHECLDSSCGGNPCPTGESCRRRANFDATASLMCQTLPIDASHPYDTGLAAGAQCSVTIARGLDGTRLRQQIEGRSKICASESCFAPGYCGGPCRRKTDCPTTDYSGAPMTCVYLPFQQTCARNDFNTGKALGEECAGASAIQADNTCASLYCSTATNRCTARKPSGASCARADECEALVCVAGKCLQPCQSTTDCTDSTCLAVPFRIDPRSTFTDPSDDRYDLATFCQSIDGSDIVSAGPPLLLKTCTRDADCPGKVCRVVYDVAGRASGLCANPVINGLSTGQHCAGNSQCNSQICVGDDETAVCSLPCDVSSDCPSGLACAAHALFNRSAARLCVPPGAGDLALCASAAAPYGNAQADDVVSDRCVPTGVLVDDRFTPESFDDRFDYVLARATTRLCDRNQDCTSPQKCVFHPWDDAARWASPSSVLRGHCEIPRAQALGEGEPCQVSASCASGLCVSNACVRPCHDVADCSAPDLCGDGEAVVLEQLSVTKTVSVCGAAMRREPCPGCNVLPAE